MLMDVYCTVLYEHVRTSAVSLKRLEVRCSVVARRFYIHRGKETSFPHSSKLKGQSPCLTSERGGATGSGLHSATVRGELCQHYVCGDGRRAFAPVDSAPCLPEHNEQTVHCVSERQ